MVIGIGKTTDGISLVWNAKRSLYSFGLRFDAAIFVVVQLMIVGYVCGGGVGVVCVGVGEKKSFCGIIFWKEKCREMR